MGSTAEWCTGPLILHFGPTLRKLTGQDFFELCRLNPDMRIEQTARGDLVIMPPTGGETGRRNSRLTGQLDAWADADGGGIAFDSSTGFTLPNGSRRSPDASWVRCSRWEGLTAEEREQFPPLCPDFVVELRSRRDTLAALQGKMQEYLSNGAQLGWLVDPLEQKVHVYAPGQPARCLDKPATLDGDPLLRGFHLDLTAIWD